jgi:hypothetical protein
VDRDFRLDGVIGCIRGLLMDHSLLSRGLVRYLGVLSYKVCG